LSTGSLEHLLTSLVLPTDKANRPLRSMGSVSTMRGPKDQVLRADRQRLSSLLSRNFFNSTETRLFDNALVSRLRPWVEVMLANYRDIWERGYAHLAPHKKVKRDAFDEWLYHRKEDTVTGEFRRYSITGSDIPVIGVLRAL
jgi:hypothetical protein